MASIAHSQTCQQLHERAKASCKSAEEAVNKAGADFIGNAGPASDIKNTSGSQKNEGADASRLIGEPADQCVYLAKACEERCSKESPMLLSQLDLKKKAKECGQEMKQLGEKAQQSSKDYAKHSDGAGKSEESADGGGKEGGGQGGGAPPQPPQGGQGEGEQKQAEENSCQTLPSPVTVSGQSVSEVCGTSEERARKLAEIEEALKTKTPIDETEVDDVADSFNKSAVKKFMIEDLQIPKEERIEINTTELANSEEQVSRLIASENYCEAYQQIEELKYGNVHKKEIAKELEAKLNSSLRAKKLPEGLPGLLNCQ